MDGIQYTIELLGKLDEATQATKALTEVMRSAEKTDRQVRKHEHSVGLLGKAYEHAKDSLKDFARETLAHFTALASFEGIKRLGEGIVDMGKDALHAAASAAKMEHAFGMLFGEERGARLIEGAEKLSKINEFSGEANKAAVQQLQAAGIKDNRVFDVIQAAADMAAKTGKGEEVFQEALAKFEMAQTTGKAPMRISQLGFGENATKQIQAEIARGRTSVDAMLAVFQKSNAGKPIGALAESRLEDVDVKMRKLSELPERFYERLSKTEAFDKVSASLGKILEAFDPDTPRGVRIFKGLELMVTKIADVFAKIDVDKIANGLISTFEALPPLISAATKAMEAFARAASFLFANPDQTAAKFEKALTAPMPAQGFGKSRYVAGGFDQRSLTQRLGLNFDISGETFKKWFGFDVTKPMVGDAKKTGADTVEGYVKGVSSGVPDVGKAGGGVATAAIDGTKDKLQSHSPSRVFAQLGMFSSQGYAMGMEDAMPDVEMAAAGLASPDLVPEASFAAPTAAAVVAGAASGGGGDNSTNLEAHVTINITAGPGGEGQAAAVAEAAATSIKEALQTSMRQLRAEGAA